MKYTIQCLQGAPLSSWGEPRTLKEIKETFLDYARMEWDNPPQKLSIREIEELWQVKILTEKSQ